MTGKITTEQKFVTLLTKIEMLCGPEETKQKSTAIQDIVKELRKDVVNKQREQIKASLKRIIETRQSIRDSQKAFEAKLEEANLSVLKEIETLENLVEGSIAQEKQALNDVAELDKPAG